MKAKPLHEMDPEKVRAGVEKMASKKIPDWITLEKVNDGALKGEWHRPDNASGDGLILYFHGGGYVFGSPRTHRPISFALARGTARTAFSLDYRLAPEHPAPAAVEDALACYRQLLEDGYDPASIAVAGDSAGGGLALALALAARQEGLPRPSCLVLYSPWADLTVSGPSVRENEKTDSMFQAAHIYGGAKNVVGNGDPAAPLTSPLFGDFRVFPPTLIFASDAEILRDDSVRLHEKMREAGVDATLVLKKGLTHAWPIFVHWIPEGRAAVERSVAFINNFAKMERAA